VSGVSAYFSIGVMRALIRDAGVDQGGPLAVGDTGFDQKSVTSSVRCASWASTP
jgi:hypothetical protein